MGNIDTVKFLGILLASLTFTILLAIPFINLLYKLKFQRRDQKGERDVFKSKTPVYSKLHAWKVGTPIGGGILVVFSTLIFSLLFYIGTQFTFNWTTITLFLTFIGFALLGFYDDLRKIMGIKRRDGIWGMRLRHKFFLQWLLALGSAWLLFEKVQLSTVWLPLLGNFDLGLFFIPFAALVIVSSVNAFNITDGLDGLAGGLLAISLVAFWVLLAKTGFGDALLFLVTLFGSLLAFLYFNIYPARFWMGDTGALAFGSVLAIFALLANRVAVLPIIGGIFVIEALSSLAQWGSRRYRDRKIFLSAPLHHHLEASGWQEPKIVMRFWLVAAALAFVGLFVAFL